MVRSFPHILICIVATAAPASAAEPRSFESYLRSAAILHESLEFEQALEALDQAASYSRDLHDDVVLALWRGVILADHQKPAEADAAFRRGLSLDIDAQLPTAASPKIVRDFEAARASIKKLKPAPMPVREVPAIAPALTPTASTEPSNEVAFRPGSVPLTVTLGVGAVVAGAASLSLGLMMNQQLLRMQQATYQVDAVAPAQAASSERAGAWVAGGLAVALLTTAIISWVLTP